MPIRREAAFHEAGHAVAAHRSQFHNIVGTINLADYGAGEIYVSLSKRKLALNRKPADGSAQEDKDVVLDLAVVLAAGLVAERIAEERENGLKADPACAQPDHALLQQQLVNAGLSKKLDPHEHAARRLLESEWSLVADVAAFLLARTSVDSVEVQEFIDSHASGVA